MLKVCLVIDWHPSTAGGVQSHVRGLARSLSSMGHEVVIVTKGTGLKGGGPGSDEYLYINPLLPLNVVIVPPSPGGLKSALSGVNPDIVHAHHIFTFTSLMSLRAAKALNMPRLITNHTIFLAHERGAVWRNASLILPTRYYIADSQAIISVSKAADEFVSHFVDDWMPRYVIPNGIDVEVFRPPASEPEGEAVLYLGRLVYRKGVHVLIKAFASVAGDRREARLIVAGGGYMEPALRALARRLGVEGRVSFLGPVPEAEKPGLLRRATVVAVPSIVNESFGIVALEAMASGRPVVASRQGGLTEVIEHGYTGLLVRPGSVKELSSSIQALLEDKSLRARLGSNARKVVEERFKWSVVTGKILEVYEELTSSPP